MPDPLPPLVSRLATEYTGVTIPPEIRRWPCSSCGEMILLAPSSVALIEGGKARPLCPGCLDKERQAGNSFVPVMTPAQVADHERYRRDDVEKN